MFVESSSVTELSPSARRSSPASCSASTATSPCSSRRPGRPHRDARQMETTADQASSAWRHPHQPQSGKPTPANRPPRGIRLPGADRDPGRSLPPNWCSTRWLRLNLPSTRIRQRAPFSRSRRPGRVLGGRGRAGQLACSVSTQPGTAVDINLVSLLASAATRRGLRAGQPGGAGRPGVRLRRQLISTVSKVDQLSRAQHESVWCQRRLLQPLALFQLLVSPGRYGCARLFVERCCYIWSAPALESSF